MPPTPSKVIGKSKVTPLLVIVLVPEVAAKVVTCEVAVIVIPEAIIKFPYIVLGQSARVPEKPVKSKFKNAPYTKTVSVPAVILKLGALASARKPGSILRVPVAPE